VRLEPGTHIVDMELSCIPLRAGGCVTLAALFLALALTSVDARRRRRAA
jgi:hypothetical protein